MPDLSSLPESAVQLIIQRGRGRCILGTNKYARVCRQWLKASGSPAEAEDVQLLMNPVHMSAEELQRAADWVKIHGQKMTTLVMDTRMNEAQQQEQHGLQQPLQWFWTAAPSLTRLRRLEVELDDSLYLLAPVLGQLAQLQHMSAC